MQGAVLCIILLESQRLFPQLLPEDLLAQGRRCAARAASARGADRPAALVVEVASCASRRRMRHGQPVGFRLALQGVAGESGLGRTIGRGNRL